MSWDNLDVLVVYSDSAIIGLSKAQRKKLSRPFDNNLEHHVLNKSYAYMLQACTKLGLSAGLASSEDIVGEGQVSGYWSYDEEGWQASDNIARCKVVFDKFSPSSAKRVKQRKVLFGKRVRPFNAEALYSLFFDKLNLYRELSDYVVPTVAVRNSKLKEIARALNKLSELTLAHDDSNEFARDIVLKDRSGAGGQAVYLVKNPSPVNLHRLMSSHNNKQFILQPRIQFENGYSYKGRGGQTEIRVIYANSRIIQSYVRIAGSSDKLCNDHQGGESIYIKLNEIPKRVVTLGSQISDNLPTGNGIYALDFVVSDSGSIYLLEGNTGPGLNWSNDNPAHESKSKELIDNIASILAKRVSAIRNRSVAIKDYNNLPIYSVT